MSEKVYLVDGSGYIFRAFYAVAPLSNKEGFPTNALFGFVKMLLKLIRQASDGHLAVVFDAGRETFRNQMYSEYKANRSETPPELVKQMPYFREISRALGLPVLELQGYEADDIIGTLAERFAKAGQETVVVSGDKDLLQLVGGKITVWDTMKDKIYRDAEVVEKFGVKPDKVVEVLGLIGDDSDNVPGLNGCGPKTAVQLIEKYGDVETVLKSAQVIAADASIRNRKKIAELIESNAEIVRLSRKLVEINRNTPVMFQRGDSFMSVQSLSDSELLEAVRRGEPHQDSLSKLVERFEFSSLLKEFGLPSAQSAKKPKADYLAVLAENFTQWLSQLKAQKFFAFDTETTSLDPLQAKLVGASFCWDDNQAFYIPIGHRTIEGQVSLEEFIARVGPVLNDAAVKKSGQNLKYDAQILACHGVELRGITFDTMVASYVLTPDKNGHNLTDLARDLLGWGTIEFDEVLAGAETFADVPLEPAVQYACQDAHYAWLIAKILGERLAEAELKKLFETIEMPLVSILAKLELAGITLDAKLLADLSEEFGSKLAAFEKQIYFTAGSEFNINSPKQLSDILFNRLGISTKGLKKTKTGISTDSSVLEKLALEHPLPGQILEYRSIHKLKSTYVDSLPQQISKVDGRLHTRLNQTVAATGRLSSSDPNLQNIPIQSAEGRRIREAFIADPRLKTTLISADYSQIELRVLAHLAGDENLISAFKEGIDIHAKTAREILGLSATAEVDSVQRRMGKTINFGVVYGMSGFRLGRELGLPVHVANEYIDNYFNRYPKVREYFAKLENDAESKGYVTTLFGRKRFLADIDSSGRDYGFVRRASINAPIQGTAADIIKLAMIAVQNHIEAAKLPVKMLLQIHDELLFEADTDAADAISKEIKSKMEAVVDFAVPLEVGVGIGKNWQEAHG